MATEKQLCTFYLDQFCFGIYVVEVQEVFRFQEMTSVPLAPKVISGLINLRGQIITAINLRLRFEMEPSTTGRPPMNVVIGANGEITSLLVDQIGDVIDISDDCFEPAPESMEEGIKDLISGVYKLPDKLLLVLDTKKVVQFQAVAA